MSGENGSASGSLAARAQARRQQLLERKSIRIEVPGYEGILEMEYRALSYPEARKVQARCARISDDAARDTAIACDGLILASIDAWDMTGEEPVSLGMGWGVALARQLGVTVEESMTVRQSVIACFVTDVWLMNHWNEYSAWAGSASVEVDEEQRLDFSPTTSSS